MHRRCLPSVFVEAGLECRDRPKFYRKIVQLVLRSPHQRADAKNSVDEVNLSKTVILLVRLVIPTLAQGKKCPSLQYFRCGLGASMPSLEISQSTFCLLLSSTLLSRNSSVSLEMLIVAIS